MCKHKTSSAASILLIHSPFPEDTASFALKKFFRDRIALSLTFQRQIQSKSFFPLPFPRIKNNVHLVTLLHEVTPSKVDIHLQYKSSTWNTLWCGSYSGMIIMFFSSTVVMFGFSHSQNTQLSLSLGDDKALCSLWFTSSGKMQIQKSEELHVPLEPPPKVEISQPLLIFALIFEPGRK